MTNTKKIAIVGAGNVATHFAKALNSHHFNIIQIYSRTLGSAKTLATTINTDYTCHLNEITADADLYIISLKDSALKETLPAICQRNPNALFVHTAGSISIDIWNGIAKHYGVVYPMQTFSKEKEIDFRNIPIFIESNTKKDQQLLMELFSTLSSKVMPASSEQRKYLHLAAVFACNFSNHMYAICKEILDENHLPFECMLPLIDETAQKVHKISPVQAQTGPAQRNDQNVIGKHIEMLNDNKELKEIYSLVSENIHKYSQSKK